MIDFHNHLIPGVDDGATDLDQTREALAVFREQGVRTVVATPHLKASLVDRSNALEEFLGRVDEAWEGVLALGTAEFPEMRLERGFEVMLDVPEPDLSDPRLRLAGTSSVLVEFPFMTVPPNAEGTLFALKVAGWTPVLAHPERYGNLDPEGRAAEGWRRVGARLQVNGGSLLGRYGSAAEGVAWGLLRRGWADYLCSDYHARGRCPSAEARAELERRGGAEQARLLTETNPARLLDDAPPEPVPPLRGRRPFWKRILGRG